MGDVVQVELRGRSCEIVGDRAPGESSRDVVEESEQAEGDGL